MGLLDNIVDQWNRASRDYAMANTPPERVAPVPGIPSLTQAMMQMPAAAPMTGWDAKVSPSAQTPTMAAQSPTAAPPPQAAPASMPQQTPMAMGQPTQQAQQPGLFDRLSVNPLFLAGLTGFGGYGPGTGAQLAQANQRGQMEQQEWQRTQQQRQRMQEAWGRIFPNGQPAASHPLLKDVPAEITTLAQAMGPEEGLDFLGRYAMSRNKALNPLQQAQLYNLMNPGQVAAAKKSAEMQVEAQQQLPGAIADAETALDVINQTRSHPGLGAGTGWTSNLMSLSPRAKGFDALVKQLSGQAFLASIQKMRGMGSLSDAEGKAAREASARLETAQSKEEFMKALDDLEHLVRKGVQGAYSRAGQRAPAAPDTSGWSLEAID